MAEIDGQSGGRDWWSGAGQVAARVAAWVAARVAARVAAGVSTRVAPSVCRYAILRRKEILKSYFKNAVSMYTILIGAIRSQRPVNKLC